MTRISVSHGDTGVELLSVKKLQRRWPPWEAVIWRRVLNPIQPEEISDAIKEGRLIPPSSKRLETYRKISGDGSPRKVHVERIAWLVVNRFIRPILIDVGVPGLTLEQWPIEDGNHRYLAACYRGDLFIRAECSGSIDLIEELSWTTRT